MFSRAERVDRVDLYRLLPLWLLRSPLCWADVNPHRTPLARLCGIDIRPEQASGAAHHKTIVAHGTWATEPQGQALSHPA